MRGSNNPIIALIDDDSNILEMLDYSFLKEGFKTKCFNDSELANNFLKDNKVDAIVTDWMMPNINGLQLIENLKSSVNRDSVKFMVSCRSEEQEVVKALESGLADYLCKPLRIKELIFKVKSKLPSNTTEAIVGVADLKLNLDTFEASGKNGAFILTKSEFMLLELFMKKVDKVYDRNFILGYLNDGNYLPSERSVDVLINQLRKKLKDQSICQIKSLYGIGYKITY